MSGAAFRPLIVVGLTLLNLRGAHAAGRLPAKAVIEAELAEEAKGATAVSEGRFDDALKHFEAARKLVPSFVKALKTQAITLQRMDRCAEAMPLLDEALERYRDPKHPKNDPATTAKLIDEKATRTAESIADLERARERCQKPPEPPPVDKPPRLIITTDPPGADVRIDVVTGAPVGQTPFNTDEIKVGHHRIHVAKEGFEPETRDIDLAAGVELQQAIPLRPIPIIKPSLLVVVTEPPGADVRIDVVDGPPVGLTPFSGVIKVGHHRIHVTKEGYQPEVREVDVIAGQGVDQSITLTVQPFVAKVSRKRRVDIGAGVGVLFTQTVTKQSVAYTPTASVSLLVSGGYALLMIERLELRIGGRVGLSFLSESVNGTVSNYLLFTVLVEPEVRLAIVPRRFFANVALGVGLLNLSGVQAGSFLVEGNISGANSFTWFALRPSLALELRPINVLSLQVAGAVNWSPTQSGFTTSSITRYELIFGVGLRF